MNSEARNPGTGVSGFGRCPLLFVVFRLLNKSIWGFAAEENRACWTPRCRQACRNVRLRFAQLSLLLAWVCANGAIWDAVQVFAWSKMFVGYASTMTVPAALRET